MKVILMLCIATLMVLTACSYMDEETVSSDTASTVEKPGAHTVPDIAYEVLPAKSPIETSPLKSDESPAPAEIGIEDMTFSGLTLMKSTIEDAKDSIKGLVKTEYADVIAFHSASAEFLFLKTQGDTVHRLSFVRITGETVDFEGPRSLKYGMDARDFLKAIPNDGFDLENPLPLTSVLYARDIVENDDRVGIIPPSAICTVHPPKYKTGNILIAYPVDTVSVDDVLSNGERNIPMFRIWISFDENYKVNYLAVYYGAMLED